MRRTFYWTLLAAAWALSAYVSEIQSAVPRRDAFLAWGFIATGMLITVRYRRPLSVLILTSALGVSLSLLESELCVLDFGTPSILKAITEPTAAYPSDLPPGDVAAFAEVIGVFDLRKDVNIDLVLVDHGFAETIGTWAPFEQLPLQRERLRFTLGHATQAAGGGAYVSAAGGRDGRWTRFGSSTYFPVSQMTSTPVTGRRRPGGERILAIYGAKVAGITPETTVDQFRRGRRGTYLLTVLRGSRPPRRESNDLERFDIPRRIPHPNGDLVW